MLKFSSDSLSVPAATGPLRLVNRLYLFPPVSPSAFLILPFVQAREGRSLPDLAFFLLVQRRILQNSVGFRP